MHVSDINEFMRWNVEIKAAYVEVINKLEGETDGEKVFNVYVQKLIKKKRYTDIDFFTADK